MVNVGEPRRQSVVDGEAENYLSTGAKARSATGVQEGFLKSPSRVAFSRANASLERNDRRMRRLKGSPTARSI